MDAFPMVLSNATVKITGILWQVPPLDICIAQYPQQKVDHPRDVLFSSRINAIALIAETLFCISVYTSIEA